MKMDILTKLGTTESKSGIRENGDETFEPIVESSRIVPVMCANVSTVVGGNSSTVNDDSHDNEPNASNHLDDSQDELNYDKIY